MSEYTITDKVERFDLFSFGMDTIMKHKTILSIPKPYMNLQWQIPHRSWTFQSQSPNHQNNPSYSHCPCPTFSPAHVIVSAAVAVGIVVVLDGVLCEEIGKEPPYKAYIFVYIVNYPKRSHCWEQAATQQHPCMSVILDWSQHSGWVGLGFLPQTHSLQTWILINILLLFDQLVSMIFCSISGQIQTSCYCCAFW